MVWLPFLCLAIGLIIGVQKLSKNILKSVDIITNAALMALMLTIGCNIGINDSIMSNLGMIGFNCAVVSLFAVAFSIVFTAIVEKTILPLEVISKKLYQEKININNEIDISVEDKKKTSPLVWIMPACIIIGVIAGSLIIPKSFILVLKYSLTTSMVILYIGVGISLGSNYMIFRYIKMLGWKTIFLSVAIFAGSLVGGALSGIILGLPLHISVISSSGMSYYSVTGAYMTQVYGIEAGMYGFIVNVMREFFTVLLLPILIKISKGSPIAGGAAGDMDTMLVPVTKFVGPELGLVALITGTILTFAVPFILPLLYNLFS